MRHPSDVRTYAELPDAPGAYEFERPSTTAPNLKFGRFQRKPLRNPPQTPIDWDLDSYPTLIASVRPDNSANIRRKLRSVKQQ